MYEKISCKSFDCGSLPDFVCGLLRRDKTGKRGLGRLPGLGSKIRNRQCGDPDRQGHAPVPVVGGDDRHKATNDAIKKFEEKYPYITIKAEYGGFDDEFTPRVGSLKCENIECKNCCVAGMFFYGLPEMPIGDIQMEHIRISFAEDAEPGFPAMMDHIDPVKKMGIFAANVSRFLLNDVKIEGYEGDELTIRNIPDFKQEEMQND